MSQTHADPGPGTLADLEGVLGGVEQRLAALADAVQLQDSTAVERAAAELHAALALAVRHFSGAARRGPVPAPLRRRLAAVSGQVAAQREALARATASLDRALDVLMPASPARPAVYGAHGANERPSGGGVVQA